MFVINPLNTTATMSLEAAFSCSVRPADSIPSLVTINWFFEAAESTSMGSASGMIMMPSSSPVMATRLTDVEIVGDLAHRGTSILRLFNVNMDDRGFYFCQAMFSDGRTRNSSGGFLEVMGGKQNNYCSIICAC